MNEQAFQELLKKIETAKEKSGVDLSTAEDLSIAVMNLISLEEHFFFTGAKTEKKEYYDLSNEVRNVRRELLKELVGTHEGETWCATKHLLAATMRIVEVGNKLQSEDKKKEAQDMYAKAYKVYALFWALRLKLVDIGKLKDVKKEKDSWSLEDLVTKLANCCNE